jgi:hypothetical protein
MNTCARVKHSPAEEIKDGTSKISSARNQALVRALAVGLKTQDQIEENETGPALVVKGALTQENPVQGKPDAEACERSKASLRAASHRRTKN